MSGFHPRSILPKQETPRPPTLVERVRAHIAPAGTKVTQEQADILVGLVNRSDARVYLRGRGPHLRVARTTTLEAHLGRIRRRVRRRQKRLAQRVRL